MKKTLLRWVLVLAVLLPCLVVGSMAAESVSLDLSQGSIALEKTATGVQYTQNGTTVTAEDAVYIIRQSNSNLSATANTITVSGGEVAVSVMGVNISTSAASPVSVKSGAHLVLTLLGDNTLTATGRDYAGLEVPAGAELTIKGTGTLTATGGSRGAGIGGGEQGDGGTITINGGTVTATGGGGGAGIGGGYEGNGGITTISGGKVTATGGFEAAGIGGGFGDGVNSGYNGDGGTITITGGEVTATGGGGGAGIGGGAWGGGSGSITITGGTVTAAGGSSSASLDDSSSGSSGAGIGSGFQGDGGTIAISGGMITATGGPSAAGIGGGYHGDGGSITIEGGTVTATGGEYGAGIGSGKYADGGTITITGGTITATGGSSGAGIGGGGSGYYSAGGTVVIRGAAVTAKGDYHAIGGGGTENKYGCASITISNATLDLRHTNSNGSLYQERIFDLEMTDTAALVGGTLVLPTVARGASGLSYQWQSSVDKSSWTDIAGQTSATLAIPMTAELEGMYFRCKVTNYYGNVVYTDSAQGYVLAFAKQPTPVNIDLGDYAVLEAKSTCDQVTYHWERSYDNGISWNVVPGEVYASLLVNATLSENGALYRCVITAANGDQLASDAVPITVNSSDVTYKVQYYHQLPDGSGYVVAAQTVLVGVTNNTVTAPTRTFDGFVENTAKGAHSGTVASDGSLVLSRYYDRKDYSITFDMMGGSALPAITTRYGGAVSAPADPVRYGYNFGGWYADKELTTPYEFTTMPLNGATVYAKWVSLDTGRGIEYKINGILFRDANNYEPLTGIPKGDFMAEVSVTNLSSTHMDTVLFVCYAEDDRMLGFHYAFADPDVGETMTFGTAIDNDDGLVYKVKVMILSSLAGATPLAEPVER